MRRPGSGLARELWLVELGIFLNSLGYGAVLPFEVIHLHNGRGFSLGNRRPGRATAVSRVAGNAGIGSLHCCWSCWSCWRGCGERGSYGRLECALRAAMQLVASLPRSALSRTAEKSGPYCPTCLG
jgi:hypothetical protein